LEITLELGAPSEQLRLFGLADAHLRMLRESLGVRFTARDRNLLISGNEADVTRAAEIIRKMQSRVSKGSGLDAEDVTELLERGSKRRAVFDKGSMSLSVYSSKNVIKPSTNGQWKYIEKMLSNDLTFCIGPAGTGKTYLAVAVAVSMLKSKQIRRIILARPAVEAGEKLGFLPGDLQEKVNPYLRPLFDALEDMMDFSQMRKFMELDVIEIIPLAFMRGRTLNESVIICDEAQNTSAIQMLMMLTRLGRGSKMIVTGDITQIDLKSNQRSGMVEAIETLRRIRGIGYVKLTQTDIVRHRLVQNIVRAYKRRRKNEGRDVR